MKRCDTSLYVSALKRVSVDDPVRVLVIDDTSSHKELVYGISIDTYVHTVGLVAYWRTFPNTAALSNIPSLVCLFLYTQATPAYCTFLSGFGDTS